MQKLKNNEARPKFTGSYKNNKKSVKNNNGGVCGGEGSLNTTTLQKIKERHRITARR